MPGKVNSRYVRQWEAAQERNAGVTFIVKPNRFLKVEPPLAGFGFDTARNSRWDMDPAHLQFRGKLAGDMNSTRSSGLFISLLQCQDVHAGHQRSVGTSERCGVNMSAHSLRP